jgi:type I restriction enzyme S subunit
MKPSAAVLNDTRRFKPYPAYKDSGVEWLGEIPAHWDGAKMWRISSAVSGGTPSKEERAYWDGDIPWVSPKDMKRRFIDSSEDTITERAIAETGIKLIRPPVVLIVVRGMILAHTFPVAITTVPVTINQDMKALRFGHEVDPLFMAWLFEGVGKGLLGAVVDEAAHGTQVIRMDEWRSVIAPVPPRSEQHAIVAFLDRETARIDALVAKKGRLIDLLQEKRIALITRAVTKGLDPNVRMKASGVDWLGEIPAHWKVKRLKHLALRPDAGIKMGPFGSMLKELVFSDTGYKLYGQENTISGDFEKGSRWVVQQQYRDLSEYRLREGDIVVTRKGSIGNARIVPSDCEPGVIDSDTIRIRVDRDVIDSLFLTLLLHEAGDVHHQIGAVRRGAVLGGLNTTTIADLIVLVPPREEQGRLMSLIRSDQARVDGLIETIRSAIDRLKELRTALISAAVTGKIDVRGNLETAALR